MRNLKQVLASFTKLNKINRHLGILSIVLALSLSLALVRTHSRIENTLIGYDLGKLKAEEATLLEKSSLLRMQLEKLTTRQHLELLAEGTTLQEGESQLAAVR